MKTVLKLSAVLLTLLLMLPVASIAEDEFDPPEIAIGERLFLETRFAQFFAVHGTGGDSAMETTETTDEPLPGPFAGQSMNCAACHLVDQQLETSGGGMRTYADFARRSPLQPREDSKTHAVRNSPPLVNASLLRTKRPGFRGDVMFHFDGEFSSMHDLVKATYTGRMAGWLPGEKNKAIRHFAHIIRTDDGSGELAQEFGGAYAVILKGIDPSIPAEFRLQEEFRIDVNRANDEEIFETVTRLTAAYVDNLQFSRDDEGNFNLSPYDVFLAKNDLPQKPAKGESEHHYSQRLLRRINKLHDPQFVTEQDGEFAFHDQPFIFGSEELEGMKLFFSKSGQAQSRDRKAANCIACHPAPNFTDFAAHNTGATQIEYDTLHGAGAFSTLFIPNLDERNTTPQEYLPATEKHPEAREPYRAIPDINHPGLVDLGIWNIYANPDFSKTQGMLSQLLCEEARKAIRNHPHLHKDLRHHPCAAKNLLERSIAMFKTPGLRDLGHSAPYMHNGQLDTLENVIEFYRQTAGMARDGQLRNASPDLLDVHIDARDVAPLAAFLRALNEDYE
jgi:hypothetical protein